ncbi:RTA1-domain-containing protein [Coprinopsis marcescibilis]|uniref:RTA1-domain-containing protein n=1 Tax=Coprinopsis marcescibilis TaxID=230819 RepID=A0A5C3L2F0_COPMA|nr:RTA1-domain-containing protein [Coprinopsis marcescibilis]
MSSSNPNPSFDISTQATPSNIYGYIPSKTSALAFIVLFGLATLIHSGTAIKKRMWFWFPTVVLGGALETVGWSGRLWSHHTPTSVPAFQLQIIMLINGPTPLLAANFIIFGRIIRVLGTSYSRLQPLMYTTIFVFCDVVSLAVQGGGGAVAAKATDLAGANRGGNIMLGGIAFQLFVIVAYLVLAVEYFVRYTFDKPINSLGIAASAQNREFQRGQLTEKMRAMLVALLFNTLCLFVRAVFRTIELAEGWRGRLIQTQLYFDVLDGAMIVLATYAFILGHPGWLLEHKPITEEQASPSGDAL